MSSAERNARVGLGIRSDDVSTIAFHNHGLILNHSHQRTRSASRLPASRSAGTAASGGTDLSRVIESNAIKRGHGHQSSSSGSSACSRLVVPRPSTPTKDARPSTPPPRSAKQRLLKNMDPSVASAVTVLTSLSLMRTPVSDAAFHMSPAPPPSSDMTMYKHSMGPPASPFRTPSWTPSSGAGRTFDYYDSLADGPTSAGALADDLDKSFGGPSSVGRAMGGGLLGPGGVPRTPATPSLAASSAHHRCIKVPTIDLPCYARFS